MCWGKLDAQGGPTKLFAACEKYLEAQEATANTKRAVEFDRQRLEVIKRHLGDVKLSAIISRTGEANLYKKPGYNPLQ